MAAPLMNERDLEFMLYELFDAEGLTKRPATLITAARRLRRR